VEPGKGIAGTFSDNLLTRFNEWFLLYLYLTLSFILSIAPSPQDMINAAAGMILMILAGTLVVWSGIPWAMSLLTEMVRLLWYGFTLGLVYGLVALADRYRSFSGMRADIVFKAGRIDQMGII
jgi:hypothetical protein